MLLWKNFAFFLSFLVASNLSIFLSSIQPIKNYRKISKNDIKTHVDGEAKSCGMLRKKLSLSLTELMKKIIFKQMKKFRRNFYCMEQKLLRNMTF